MEVQVKGVYFGDSPVYHCSTATFSKCSIKMTLSRPGDCLTETVLILKKNILDIKASKLCPVPVICLKLKDLVCQEIGELLKLDEIGVKFNSRSKDMTEVWMLIYYNFTTFEAPKFLASNYIEKKDIVPFEEMKKFIKFPPGKMILNKAVVTILSEREEQGEPKPEICLQSQVLMVPPEVLFMAKKFANYIGLVIEGKAVKGRDVEVIIDPNIFSANDVKQMEERYKSCLVCAACHEEAIQKCKGCEVTRYCSRSCQEKNFLEHKEECSLLLAERKKKEVQESLLMKQVLASVIDDFDKKYWENRVQFKVYEKKFTDKMRENIRKRIRERISRKEINACVLGVDNLTS